MSSRGQEKKKYRAKELEVVGGGRWMQTVAVARPKSHRSIDTPRVPNCHFSQMEAGDAVCAGQ